VLAVMEPATVRVHAELPHGDVVAMDAQVTAALWASCLVTLQGHALGSDSRTNVPFATRSPCEHVLLADRLTRGSSS